jgi:hypothetical protein
MREKKRKDSARQAINIQIGKTASLLLCNATINIQSISSFPEQAGSILPKTICAPHNNFCPQGIQNSQWSPH